MIQNRYKTSRRDGGFTLTEMLIVVTVMVILVTTLGAVLVVVFRTSPAALSRTDDARSIQGLVTWLPQDVDAAPPDGFYTDVGEWPCGGSAPAESHNILTMRWDEELTSTTYFAASYRYEKRDDAWTMVRYECDDPTATPTRINLTAPLPAWSTNPAKVVMCPVAIDSTSGGICPSPYPAGNTNPDPVLSVKLSVTLQNGIQSTIDAAPKNPDQDLSDDPAAAFNAPPYVPNTAPTFQVERGQTKTIDLFAALADPLAPAPNNQIHDPDGDTSLLTVSIDPVEPEPDGDPANDFVLSSTAWPLELELTAAINAPLGSTPNRLVLIVSDEDGGWDAINANIVVIPAPNAPPQANDPVAALYIPAGSTRSIIDFISEFQIVDENPSALSFTVANPIVGVTTAGPGVAPAYQLDVNANISLDLIAVPGGQYVGRFDVLVFDNEPLNPPVIVYVDVYIEPAPVVNTSPTALASNVSAIVEAGQSIAITVTDAPAAGHGVSDSDPGDTISIDPVSIVAPAGITATKTGPLTISLAADITLPAGAITTPVQLTVVDTAGVRLDLTVSVSITIPPPLVSDCSLQSLTATPNPVNRETITGSAAKHLAQNVTITLTYNGSCDGLRLNYDSGHTSGLGTGPGRTFPANSPASITIVGAANGGTEKFTPVLHTLTASTTSPVTAPNPSSLTVDLDVR